MRKSKEKNAENSIQQHLFAVANRIASVETTRLISRMDTIAKNEKNLSILSV